MSFLFYIYIYIQDDLLLLHFQTEDWKVKGYNRGKFFLYNNVSIIFFLCVIERRSCVGSHRGGRVYKRGVGTKETSERQEKIPLRQFFHPDIGILDFSFSFFLANA